VYFGGFGPDGPPEWHEVIGVVGDVRHRTLEADPDPRAYDLFGQHWGRTVSLAVRSRETAPQIAGIVRALLADRDPQLAVFAVQPMTAIVGAAVSTRRLLLAIVIAFASVGVFVALIGLYGTVAYMVAQRTREMGVRLALGASGRQIRRLVLRRGLQMVAGGIALGVAGGWTLRQTIESQLFGLTAMNVPALGAAALALLAAAATACLVPAIHAMRINPVEALKSE
jgi:ABC-type antimicrobial peptide transport system permease subunit